MIFITGDTHGGIDIKKLSSRNFPLGKTLTKKDFLIITGDFGFIWSDNREDKYWLKWLNDKPFTTLFVDGNHENFDLLNTYPKEIWNGGNIRRINDSVLHLLRGQIFTINGLKFFTFGGAKSSDIEYRTIGKSWWIEEMPSREEYLEGCSNLKKHNWAVDFIITHTCSKSTLELLKNTTKKNNEITAINKYFNIIENKASFNHWFFGHFHIDLKISDKQTILYQEVVQIL